MWYKAFIDLILDMLLFSVEVRPARSACLQSGGSEEVEEWGEATEEGPVSQPGNTASRLVIIFGSISINLRIVPN